MDLLLDTHAIIWFLSGNKSLSKKAKIAIEDSSNLKIISIVSIWEMAIKISLGKLELPNGLNQFLKLIEDNYFSILPITFEHAIELSTLEFIHRDPFDRLLIAQSKADNLTHVTKDRFIKQYDIKTLW